ncbi:hypothetical protein NP603_16325 [Methylomonas sp. SURF-1]|uniref:Phage head morphogenesis domain-containing protein n=2 Tax=Methylomonas TaxID=416 RepID=A0ABT1TK45_9GAMM|nr:MULTISPECIES: hypothetical protein [unclassified Methylomonas]MCQ8105835.1 hypothetical protein [Methylomonas sp. SURF-2]MCQ8182689.1 hypothetical protein [Methylomonas sp. SURF-1]
MKTVQNARIRVIVSDAQWQAYANRVPSSSLMQTLPSGDVRHHSLDNIVRGRILSDAMEIIGNQSEAVLLDQEPFHLSAQEVHDIAFNVYMSHWLRDHSKYGEGVTFGRYLNGKRLSRGMAYEIDAARVYAQAALRELDYEQLYRDTVEKYLPGRQDGIFRAAQAGRSADASADVEEAIYWRWYQWDNERRYRHRFDNTDDFKIEIIDADAMPQQIGLCRYLPLAA